MNCCPGCNYDRHRCPGCGQNIRHGESSCLECRAIRLRVPEALEKLVALVGDAHKEKVQRILDAVWLQAYEEGEEHVFS